jgi:N-acyl amino acid synthase of PEP-CTERM/exosortase system
LETDPYDAVSSHALLCYRKTGETVGTVRLVPGAQAETLPMYSLLEKAGIGRAALPPLERTAEISRFAVSNEFRRRLGDALYGKPVDEAPDGRRVIPHVTLGLMAMAFRMSRQCGVEYFCAVMEPSLIRLLARFGMRWQMVGPPLDYHGLRQSCFARIDEMAAAIAAERPDIYDLLTDPRFCGGEAEEGWRVH